MKHLRLAAKAIALLALAPTAHALTFNFSFVAGTSPQAQQAFIDAGARWSALFADPITVDLTVGEQNLGPNFFASTSKNLSGYGYGTFRAALTGDATSGDDAIATANLPSGNAFGLLINRTRDNPNGMGSATPYVDASGANNERILITNANAKALGLTPFSSPVGACTSACDGSIVFGTAINWDYDPRDGISPGSFDFVGSATREIGEMLGFWSGIDLMQGLVSGPNPPVANSLDFVSALDLFRFSTESFAAGVLDWTADNRGKYFSIDGGNTRLGPTFSTGTLFGDGSRASRWKNNQGLGIMDPFLESGELGVVSANDVRAFDVIGYTLVPEPSTQALLLLGVAGLLARLRARPGRSRA